MSMVIKSKQILTATLIVALTAAVAVNWYYTNNSAPVEGETTVQQVSGNLGDSLYVAGTTAPSDALDSTTENSAQDEASSQDAQQYFADAKLKRTQSHDEIIDSIEELLGNEDLPESQESKISVLLDDFQESIKSETDAENLIKAKVPGECLVVINNGSCQVILEKNTLNDTLILQISEIIEKNTNISAENLTIIELK